MENLDSDLLRTFLVISQAGSVTDGAERIHRSQSAASLQIKRLEQIIGEPVFQRHGRGVLLTEAGQKLLPVAQDVTQRLDKVLRELSGRAVSGKIRFGLPDDLGRAKLTEIIAHFSRRHPEIELDVTCALSAQFPEALKHGDLDLAVYEVETPSREEELLSEDPTAWVQHRGHHFADQQTLPVALFDQACWWRDIAIRSLEKRGKPYRIAYSSQSVSGVIAAVEAGIGVALLGRKNLPSDLQIVDKRSGFSTTPTSKLVMATSRSETDLPTDALKSAIRSAYLTVN